MNFRVRTVTVMMAIGELKLATGYSSMILGARQSPVFHYFRRKVRIHRRVWRSLGVVVRRRSLIEE